jgi:hypothetical protein
VTQGRLSTGLKVGAVALGAVVLLATVWAVGGLIASDLGAAGTHGAITPALRRFMSVSSVVFYAAETLLSGVALTVAFWVGRRILRRRPR